MSRKSEAETARAYRLVAASTIKALHTKKTQDTKKARDTKKAQDARDDRQKRRGFTPVVPAAWGANERAIDTIGSFVRLPGTNR